MAVDSSGNVYVADGSGVYKIILNVLPATRFVVSAPASATAGNKFSTMVAALDANGNTANGYTGTVHFTSTDPAASLTQDKWLTSGIGAFNTSLFTAGSQTITATETVSDSVYGSTGVIAVAAGAATHFSVSAPDGTTSGVPAGITVAAMDRYGNTANGYTGTVSFTSSDPAATLPANTTLENGSGAFSATLYTAGSQTITATDTSTSSITGTSGSIAVAAPTVTYDGGSAGGTPPATAGYQAGASVTVAGQGTLSYPGYSFGGWEDVSGDVYQPGDTFTMPASAVTLTAVWKVTTYAVDMTVSPAGAGTVSGNNGPYTAGSEVQLKATPNSGYTFANWTVGASTVTGSVYSFTMPASGVTLTANFAAISTQPSQTPTPTIDTPVYAGVASVSGTAADDAQVVLEIVNGTATSVQPAVYADGSGDWTVSGLSLTAGETISVTAQINGDTVSSAATATVLASPNAHNTGGGGGGGIVYYTPSVETEPATSITGNSAVLNGDITSDNGYDITDYGFLWGVNSSSLTGKLDVGSNDQSGTFTGTLGSLTAGTTYYFEAYATNSMGTADGTVLIFTAASSTPTTPATTPAATFSDVPPSFWAYGDIESLAGSGYVSGYPDGAFRPNAPITRAEFCAIMDQVLNITGYPPQTPTFTDVHQGDWFYKAVEEAVYAGIAKGYGDGTFRPDALISRQEIACILIQALGDTQLADANARTATTFTDDHDIAWWARGFVYEALQQSIISGYTDNSFEPGHDATRAEACAMIANFLKLFKAGK